MKPEPETQKEETEAAPAGLAAVATIRQPLPPVVVECQRLRAALEEITHAGSAEWARRRAERALDAAIHIPRELEEKQ